MCVTWLWHDKVDDHCGASGQASLGAVVKVVNGVSPHERQLAVSMGVNACEINQVLEIRIEKPVKMQVQRIFKLL